MVTHRLARLSSGFIPGPAEALCLDFANTRYWRGTATPTEELNGPEDLLRWAEAAKVVDPAMLAAIRAAWDAAPAEAAAGFGTALALREAIFRGFASLAGGGAPSAEDLGTLDAALEAAPCRSRLGHAPAGWVWQVAAGQAPQALLLAAVLWSAADLLVGARLARVRQCANDQCRWLFLDDSKSANRRWCSMSSCGNRAKAHRHYARAKQAP